MSTQTRGDDSGITWRNLRNLLVFLGAGLVGIMVLLEVLAREFGVTVGFLEIQFLLLIPAAIGVYFLEKF
jgi:hypothetical protein